MKINSRQSTLLNKCPVKTEIKKNKEPSDKVVIGDFKPDDSLFMGDKLKKIKIFLRRVRQYKKSCNRSNYGCCRSRPVRYGGI